MTPHEAFERERNNAMRLVSTLLRTRARFIEPEEARTVALGALWSVAVRHASLPEDHFSHLAMRRVRGAIADHLRSNHWLGRRGRARHPEAQRVEYDDDLHGVTTELDDAPILLEPVRRALDCLTPGERVCVEGRFFHDPPILMSELARRLRVTEPRITQLVQAGTARLRRQLAAV